VRAIAAISAFASGAGLTVVFLLVDPALDADHTIDGAGFGEAVVERDAQRLERHLAFAVPFGASDVRAAEATGAADPDALGTEVHGGLDGALHGAAERNPAFELDGHLFGDELSVEFRLADLDDVDFHLGAVADPGDVAGHHFD